MLFSIKYLEMYFNTFFFFKPFLKTNSQGNDTCVFKQCTCQSLGTINVAVESL